MDTRTSARVKHFVDDASPTGHGAGLTDPSWFRRHRGDILAVCVLAAMTLAVFWKGLVDPADMIRGDAAYLYQPYYTMAADEVRQGRFPQWNPYILMGVPFHASLQPALLYPLRWPMFFMDYVPGMVMTMLVHYFPH